MKTQAYESYIKLLILSVFVALLLPLTTNAQTGGSQTDLDKLISILNESVSNLSLEIKGLRDEIQILRTEVRGLQPVSGTVNITSPVPTVLLPVAPKPSTFLTVLRPGDSGEEVRRLQEVLIRLGFNIPAGVTGNFFGQTESALKKIQADNNLPATGILDQATLNLLNRLLNFQTVYTPPNETPTKNPDPDPIITPDLRLTAPPNGMSLNTGVEIPIIWSSTYAPAGAKVSFSLINKETGIERPVYETEDLSGTYNWTLPNSMPGNNEFIAKLLYQREGSDSFIVLTSISRDLFIYGGTVETTTTTTTNTTNTNSSNNYDSYAAFYRGSVFSTCMAEFPQTVALISGWLDEGLLQHQFPWNEITGSAANKLAECSADQFNYDDYTDCTSFTTESACSTDSTCSWFGSFCGNAGYDPLTGGGSCVGTDEASCTSVENCYWYQDTSNVAMYSCFYPNATINGTAPGYTVWCEYDYQNCREGDPSGASVSLDGLALGAPSSCESGFGSSGSGSSYCYYDSNGDPTTSASSNSFFANVATAFSKALRSVLGIFSR
jgi:peptidoglycan hydrolase-like protein with peptidoglycan-binding domain